MKLIMVSDPSVTLRPEEELVAIEEITIDPIQRKLTTLEALQLLAGVERPADIGTKGPLVASRALPENEDQPRLRLYEALFGRDSLITAYFLLDRFPLLARTTLLRLAELQGITTNDANEEEPGKIIHESRNPEDPKAQELTAKHGWQWPYYGSIDSTLLFIKVAAHYIRQHDPHFLKETYLDRAGRTQSVIHAVQQAAGWVIERTQHNSEGLIESEPLNNNHHNNQSWKDSPDSHHHTDGSLADGTKGVASIEVQALAYDALLEASDLLDQNWHARAHKLREVLLEKFWHEDERGGYFALGSDRTENNEPHPLAVRTSNMGHLLNSRLLDGEETHIQNIKQKLVATLMSPEMLTPTGIRTLSSQENRYRPTAYHNGSVWPWDTYYISLGLARQGFTTEAQDLQQRIKYVIEKTHRFPEFISGTDSAEPLLPQRVVRVRDTKYNFEHSIEQPPQEIQAWTVAAAAALEI